MLNLTPNAKNALQIASLCSTAYLAVYLARNILGAVSPQMIELGLFTEAQLGTLSSVYFITYAVGQLINGLIGNRIKAKVAIVPAGTHKCPAKREHLPIKLAQGIAILGEAMGVSPNDPTDITRPNPARSTEESVLLGSLYWGTLAMTDDARGTLLLDGLTLDNYRVHDRRTKGTDLCIKVENCIITGAHRSNIIHAAPFAAPSSTRTLAVRNCRCDGFDSTDGQGRFLNACATQLCAHAKWTTACCSRSTMTISV